MKIISLFLFLFCSGFKCADSIKSTIVLNELKFDFCLLKKNGDPNDQFIGVRLVRKNISEHNIVITIP